MLVLDRVGLTVQTDVVPFVGDRLRLDLCNVRLLLLELVVDLLDLVLQDLQLTLFVLKLVSVNVDLTLETSSLTLMNWVIPATHRGTTCN